MHEGKTQDGEGRVRGEVRVGAVHVDLLVARKWISGSKMNK